jgi:hypothetical protein
MDKYFVSMYENTIMQPVKNVLRKGEGLVDKYFVSMYENTIMQPVKNVLRKGEGLIRENDGGGESKMYCKHI